MTDRQLDELLRDPQCLLVDCKGRLWIGAGEDFVLCQDKGEWQRYRLPRQAGRPAVRVLAGESDGTVWCGSGSEGLCQFKEGKLAVLNPTAGMPQASALLVDREGNLWIGSAGSIHLLRRKQCLFLGQAEGLGHGPVSGLAEVAAGVLWTMQPGYGLCRWEGGNFRHLNAFGLSPTDTSAGVMMVTRDGAWIACTNGLLLFRDPQAVSDESLLFELPGVNITSLAEHENGRVWAGTRQGQLWQLNQGCWRMHLQLDPEFAISTLATEPGGLVWAGTDGGGVFLVGESVRRRLRTAERSLPSDAVRALHRDKEGVLWIGTVAGGLTRFWNGVSTTYTTASGLAANSIYAILEDGAGRLWLHDDAGLTCIAKPSASSRSVNVVGTYPMRTGGREEISSVAGGLPMFPKGCNTRAGQLWFGSSSGVLVAEPLEPAPAASSTALILEDVLVDGLSAAGFKPVVAGSLQTQATAPLRIGPGRHRVELQYTSPRFGSSPRFSYRMEDWDRDWVQAGAVRAAQYNHLPPGEYRFSVGLLGADGITSQAAIDLSVIPYFWQRSWVITTGALALLGSAVGCARLVERRRMKIRLRRLQQENALERERTRIAQDLHDEMGAKLCRISFLSEHAGRLDPSSRETREQIATIANDSRDLVQSLDEIVWAVNPHNDTLEHVVSYIAQYAQNYFSGTGVECQLELAERLPTRAVSSQTRHHLFLGVQEALTNILKHSGATRVKVAISYDDPTLCVQVTDDGKGFALAGPGARALNEEPFGDGVPNMRQRMEAVGGQCRVQSEPGRGTSIEFLLELNTPTKEGAKT